VPGPEVPAPPAPPEPEAPEAPDEQPPPGAPEVPDDTGIPTDPTQDDVPVGDELPPAAVGWSGTMLDFVTETLAERTECAPEDGGEAPAAPEPGAPCPAPDARAEGGDEAQGTVAPALDVEGGTGREDVVPLPA
jgi:hypothetical protein